MIRFLSNIIDLGQSPEMTGHQSDEIRLMNMVAMLSITLAAFSGLIGFFLLPEHAIFIVAVALSELVAKLCVLILHQLQKYIAAKFLFSYVTLFVYLLIIKYFGVGGNFQYLLITTFFSLVVIYQSTTIKDVFIISLYLVIGMLSSLFLFLEADPVVHLTQDEMSTVRFIAHTMNFALATMVSVIFFVTMRRRRMQQEDLHIKYYDKAESLRSISDNLQAGIFKTQEREGVKFVNPAFLELYGYESDESIINHEDPNALYDDPAERAIILAEIKEKGMLVNRLVKYRRADDTRFWGFLTCRLIEDHGVEYIIGMVTDAEAERNRETRILEAEAQMKTAQLMAQIGTWRMFSGSKIIRWSEETQRIHGYDGEAQDHDLIDWVQSLDDISIKQLETLMAKSMISNENVVFKSWYNAPNGERKYLVYTTRYERSDKIKGGIWHGTVQDRTKRHMAEEKADETQQFYEKWLHKLPIECVMFDEELRFQFISESAIPNDERRKSFIGMRNADYISERGFDAGLGELRDTMLMQAYEMDEPVVWDETVVDAKGNKHFYERHIFPISISSDGEVKRAFVSYGIDATEIKQLRARLSKKSD